jgi:hypothetical protein
VRRRCGWLKLPHDGREAPVWARKTVATESCPKSYITAESEGLVEDFLVRRRLGGMSFGELSARQVEGFLILEQALAEEAPAARREG